MSLILMSPPLGVVFGYLLTAIMVEHNFARWQTAFIVQGLISVFAAFFILVRPAKYFDISLAVARKRKFLSERLEELLLAKAARNLEENLL